MLSKEERNVIKARCEAAVELLDKLFKRRYISQQSYAALMLLLVDNSTLLGAYEELEKQTYHVGFTAKEWSEKSKRIKESLERVLADCMVDCDKWKARAQALERVVGRYASCISCDHELLSCFSEPCLSCKDSQSSWQFDESRFAGGDMQDRTEGIKEDVANT